MYTKRKSDKGTAALIGCGLFALIAIVALEGAIYYISWVLVTSFTDFSTFVSVLLTLVLGLLISSIIGGCARAGRP